MTSRLATSGRHCILTLISLAVSHGRDVGVRPSMVGFLPRGRLLKTPSGKVQRRPLAAAIARGDLELLASVSLDGGRR